MKLKKLIKKMRDWLPKRVIIISLPISDPSGLQQIADSLDLIKKDCKVLVVNGSNEITIKKVWIK